MIDLAIEAFDAATRGDDVLINAIKGVSYVVQIADSGEAPSVSRSEAERLVEAITAAGPAFVELAGANERCVYGMTGAFGLASLFGKSKAENSAATTEQLARDFFDHTVMLLCELQILRCTCDIEARGNLLRDVMTDRKIVNISKH